MITHYKLAFHRLTTLSMTQNHFSFTFSLLKQTTMLMVIGENDCCLLTIYPAEMKSRSRYNNFLGM